MLVAMVIWGVVYAATLEFARVFASYDYRTFFEKLLGPGWMLFETLYLVMALVVLSVLTSVAGNILLEVFGLPIAVCEIGFMVAVAVLLFFGTTLVEQFLSLWSFVLYAAFSVLIMLSIWRFGHQIASKMDNSQLNDIGGILSDGVTYAGYNIAAITTVLFCARHIESRRDALIGGLLGGPLAIIPGMLFYIAMSGFDPQIRAQPVPVEFLLGKLGIPFFRYAFLTVMAITLLGTCCAMIHAINERVAIR